MSADFDISHQERSFSLVSVIYAVSTRANLVRSSWETPSTLLEVG